ncbi:IQ domain-containing protein IQM2-like [Salvia miltiorrhiza]|uniref:IQ domain-containing protein IQM2-like n=1 Tax=Salvia miltiorrhiza TaxID=226208 RepID=UPI0025AB7C9B|nr:IQ domain-containing protein IQM2-like [Salvia miltiorrhiza]
MGVYRPSPLTVNSDLDSSFESIIAKLINLKDEKINKSLNIEDDDDMVSPLVGSRIPHSPKHEAAIKLQKVYKSFRTRRKLADCAVLIEQSWWKLLDFAELKHSSISFFDIDRHETAISRWSRARTRAAKVGKGLSKNGKAQKLALQHWLEAIDPRHRYGHNLHFYYVKWLNSQSKEPFFYWLDIGEGKDMNLVEKCPRSKLQQQCIKYLGPMERKAYEVVIEGGKLLYKQTGEPLDTTRGSKWIFVLSTSRTLYVGKKKKGTFQHSSFLAGGATLAAGRIVAENGVLKAVWPHSGHYKPTPENFQNFISFLRENNVDLNDVKLDSTDEEEDSLYLTSNASEDDVASTSTSASSDNARSPEESTGASLQPRGFSWELAALEIPCKDSFLEKLKTENQSSDNFLLESPRDADADADEDEECISQRINQHKESKSFQLGKQLSCNWSTGAGPRIGCVRDYPWHLQERALERVKLSPRSVLPSESRRAAASTSSILSCRTTSSSLHSSPLHSLC